MVNCLECNTELTFVKNISDNMRLYECPNCKQKQFVDKFEECSGHIWNTTTNQEYCKNCGLKKEIGR